MGGICFAIDDVEGSYGEFVAGRRPHYRERLQSGTNQGSLLANNPDQEMVCNGTDPDPIVDLAGWLSVDRVDEKVHRNIHMAF